MFKNFTDSELSRFNSKIEKTERGCWVWLAPLDKDGYGTFFFRRKGRRAHRVAYYAAFGDIPAGHVINHTCRNPSCVNPQHLNAKTHRDNALTDSSSITYINSQKTTCKNGHPYDRIYSGQRYCSKCESEKKKRLRSKWALDDNISA